MDPNVRTALAVLAGLLVVTGAAACTTNSEPGRLDAASPDAAPPDAPPPEAGAPDAGSGPDGADGGPDAGWGYGTDCPGSAPASVPADSPRILVVGPGWFSPAIAAHLRGMLAGDPAFTASVVTGVEMEANGAGDFGGGISLMNFFYQPDGRDARLAPLAEPWSYVVLLESGPLATKYPELYFEGVRVLGCGARAAGAKPVVLMTWSGAPDAAGRGEVTYRVANGTRSIVAPAGYAFEEAQALGSLDEQWDGVFIAAATLYSTLTGRSAGATSYVPAGIAADRAANLAAIAFTTVVLHAGKMHYLGAYHGTVELRAVPPGGDLWFMDSGTSSEQLWYDRMNEIVPKAGLTPAGTQIGSTNPQKTFDAACLANAGPYFQQQQYQILFARGYSVDAATIAAAGAQTDLQVQLWDRHADSDPSDGVAAVEMLEWMSQTTYDQAKAWGAVLIPYHLLFAKLKTLRPSVQMLSDGVHATYPVGYGLATMSVVSRTGITTATDGLDADTQLAARLADETIRQLSALSVSGASVPDDPGARPAAP